ncbi:MAG: sodium-translocating pyrophosphatase [Candidatus Eisenbacteria bacterium]|nr:sodium-translocating pyrophosphatase [Candidatus Eisenbacteria bacterium]
MGELSLAFFSGLAGVLFVGYLVWDVLRRDAGSETMVRISRSVQEGARAFLKREYTSVSLLVIVVAILIALAPVLSGNPDLPLGWRTAIAFIAGAIVSALAGYVGMSIATRANARTTQAAVDGGVKGALGVAVSAGSVMGMSVASLALLGLIVVYWIFRDPPVVSGYAMGASLVALFARSGGGLFTKGADMGADLVGKVEANIPEDDPRNPAVIADNVGDNVGDVAGLGADLLESYVESIIASMALAAALVASAAVSEKLMMLPFHIAGVGILASILGILFVRAVGRRNPQAALMGGTYVAAGLTAVASYVIIRTWGVPFTVGDETYGVLGPFYATVAGIASGVIVGFVSEFFTSARFSPVRRLAKSSQMGAAITVTSGTAVGMQSTAVPILVLGVAVVLAHHFAGMYGIAMAAFGMLATTGMVVAVDSYGPVADNAGGIAEMSRLDPSVRKITDNLDAVGNTTAAIGKGFAIGSAAFAAIGLLSAYMVSAGITVADMSDPKVMAGLLVGGMLPFFFSSMLFEAVSSVAFKMIEEVRRQFKEIPGLMDGKAMPDSATCVDISTRGAIAGMLRPGIMAIVVPVAIGLYDEKTLAGLLVGAVVTGVVLGIQTANSGGAMDNAKKYIEDGNYGGKGSDAHKAAVVGDTVGDPLKDTVGPSINILIKLMSVISLVLAPLFVRG